MKSVIMSFGEFLFHLLWLAIVEGLTVEFLLSEIRMVREKVKEHSDKEHSDKKQSNKEHSDKAGSESPTTEKFPEYVNVHHLRGPQLNH